MAADIERYTVTLIRNGEEIRQPTILVPFSPSALVSDFEGELFKRANRQGSNATADTHSIELRLNTANGALIDSHDILCHVIADPSSEKIFAVFSSKPHSPDQASLQAQGSLANRFLEFLRSQTTSNPPQVPLTGASISVRFVTAANSKQDRSTLQCLPIPLAATVRDLHNLAAHHLDMEGNFEQADITNECNCNFASRLSDAGNTSMALSECYVIYNKGTVGKLSLSSLTDAGAEDAVQQQFGADLLAKKKIHYHGGVMDDDEKYIKPPVVAICSKSRHIPAHARKNELADDSEFGQARVLDLHTSEIPIHAASMDIALLDTGIQALCKDGILDIFAVSRRTTASVVQYGVGQEAIFRQQSHWQPPVVQSERGMAIFLSTLRVVASLVQDLQSEPAAFDAVIHVFDLFSGFPPALRAFFILGQGKTPTAAESAALSHSVFQVLTGFMPTELIGADGSRLFEGTRLLFGLIFEKAKAVALPATHPAEGAIEYPYLQALTEVTDLRDAQTTEPILHGINTQMGFIERGHFEAFASGGLLADHPLQPDFIQCDQDTIKTSLAVLSGGCVGELVVFSADVLMSNYQYKDAGSLSALVDRAELADIAHMADLCSRNKLAVHRPSQLISAVSPCLTFDRNALLAVYTGQQPCAPPGRSSLIFRPLHGTEAIDAAVVEQLIVPIVHAYEAAGTAVFDAFGGATLKLLQRPDEVVIFCVDTSASMKSASDFEEFEEDNEPPTNRSDVLIEGSYYARANFEEFKESICKYESFDDMVAIVSTATARSKREVAHAVLTILCHMKTNVISSTSENLQEVRERYGNSFRSRARITEFERCLDEQKAFFAGLKTHEEGLCDFLVYRAAAMTSDTRWTWSIGDARPSAGTSLRTIPELPSSVIAIPDEMCCPISHGLMEDAVSAADGHTYSRQAIMHWFTIRHSSPLHGTALHDISLGDDDRISRLASQWAAGEDMVASRDSSSSISVTFTSLLGAYDRRVSATMSTEQLYKLAFRAMKARHCVFQLVTEDGQQPLVPSPTITLASVGVRDGAQFRVRIADEADTEQSLRNHDTAEGELMLVKVFSEKEKMDVAYWVDRQTTKTMASALWKWWRRRFEIRPHVPAQDLILWGLMQDSGDGHVSGSPCEDLDSQLSTHVHWCSGSLEEESMFHTPTRGSTGVSVLKLSVYPKSQPSRSHELSRIEVLKQMFEALINRTLAYGFKTHIGLVTVSSTAALKMPVSHVVENFRRATADMHADGNTALWDSIALCRDQLNQYALKYPGVSKRIVVISDGADTSSVTNSSDGIAFSLYQDKITVDSISLGGELNRDLKAISHILGGYRFHPTSLANALSICEMEPLLSASERPDVELGVFANAQAFTRSFSYGSRFSAYTVANADDFPKRKAHPNLRDSFVPLKDAVHHPKGGAQTGATDSGRQSNLRSSRLMNEMRQVVASGPHANYDVYVSETDMSFWKVVMSGPSETPYEDGVFLLFVHAEDRYPAFAPKARFVTRIKHPNVNAHGRICHSILDRDWTSDTSMTSLLDTIFGLLFQPEFSDPVNTTITLGYHHDEVEFGEEVRACVAGYAGKSRDQWKEEILEGEDWSDEENDGGDEEDEDEDEEDEDEEEDGSDMSF